MASIHTLVIFLRQRLHTNDNIYSPFEVESEGVHIREMDTFGELAFVEIDTNKENHNYQTINEQ